MKTFLSVLGYVVLSILGGLLVRVIWCTFFAPRFDYNHPRNKKKYASDY